MTDNLTPEQLRSAELNELRQSIAEHESLLERLRTVPTEGMPAEEAADHAFEVYKMEHEVDDLKAELEDVQASPLPRTTRSLGGAPANGLAVVIGHSIQGKDSGALGSGFPQSVTGDMRKEVYWNTDLANMIAADARARGIPCQLFERKRSGSSGRTAAYNEVKAWGPKATVELHFNSYNTTACGTETLYGPDGCRDWAAAVHKKFLDVLKPAAEAKGVSRSRGAWPDRKLKQRNSGRGSHSLKQLNPSQYGPSIIIEPFFGDNPVDATIAQENKQQMARAIVDAYVDWAGISAPAATPVPAQPPVTTPRQPAQPAPNVARTRPDYFHDEFWELLHAYDKTEIEFPQLRSVSFAQWATESGYGKSELAKQHLNFAGMKYRDSMREYCTSAPYVDWQGKPSQYCKFASYEKFIAGYWARLDLVSAYNGWRNHTATKEQFINFIGGIWAPTSDGNSSKYPQHVLQVHKKLAAVGCLPPDGAITNRQPASPGAGAGTGTGGGGGAPAGGGTAGGGTATQPGPVSGGVAPVTVPAVTSLVASVESTLSTAHAATQGSKLPPALESAVDGVIAASSKFLNASKTATSSTDQTKRALRDVFQAAQPNADANFLNAIALLDADERVKDYDVKLTIASQWALESDWGRSDLARLHYNFAGIEWDNRLDEVAGRVSYKDKGFYCRFDDLHRFIEGYWLRMGMEGLEDWQSKTSGQQFISYVAPVLRPNNQQYVGNVINIANRLNEARPAGGAMTSTTTGPDVTGPSPEGNSPRRLEDTTGFVIRVSRSHVETNRGKQRTVGTYQAFFNGQPLPGLEGEVFEQRGPGDNTRKGTQGKRRLEAKSYPLYTHAGAKGNSGRTKYVTHGYTSSAAAYAESRPSIKVGDTGYRSGVLWHPAKGYLNSVGCLNPSKPIDNKQNIDWGDSRTRMIDIIAAMQQHLGSDFPDKNNKRIPNATLIIEGEPQSTRSLLESRSRSTGSQAEIVDGMSDAVLKRLREPELFRVLADAINGQVLPDLVDAELFDRALKAGGYMSSGGLFGSIFGPSKKIANLRGPDGETIWQAWAEGWQESTNLEDDDERARVQAELTKVAGRLQSLGLDVNEAGRLETPLSFAAANDALGAVEKLLEFGAVIGKYTPLGKTPLINAAFNGASRVVSFLRQHVSPDAVNTRSLAATGAPTRSLGGEEEDVSEQPPPGATALEAAIVAREMLGDVDESSDPVTIERAREYDEIIRTLQN